MNNSVGVYIHIPFCVQKCFYCDFHSEPGKQEVMGAYVNALVRETREQAQLVKNRKVASIFFGGGTPSLLRPAWVKQVVNECAKNMELLPDAEITMEANPESVSLPKLEGYRNAGVNRISIGAQALDDQTLAWLKRAHTARQARRAVEIALKAGFENVCVDMMFAVPGQDVAGWLRQVAEMARWGLAGISAYQLTPEPGTALGDSVAKGAVALPEETISFFTQTEELLRAEGYVHYEISNYARPGYQCVHNTGYWEYRDYIGLGASAHSKLGKARWANIKSTEAYIAKVFDKGEAVQSREKLTPEMIRTEKLLLGLRLKKGMRIDAGTVTPAVDRMIRDGMLKRHNGRISATRKGWPLLDSLLPLIC